MGFRQELEKRIERKQEEIAELIDKVRQAESYLQGMQDTLKMVPKEDEPDKEVVLRHGSAVAQAREALRARGVPLHISEILSGIGKADTKPNRLALSGTLAAYVRDKKIFTRPAPNTFGLLEFSQVEPDEGIALKPGFGNPIISNVSIEGGHKTKAAS